MRERAAGSARAGGGAGGGPAVAERVLAAVLALEEPYRGAILRRYYEDLTPREIAARTGTPLKTVEARLARARAELRRRLDGDFGGRAAWGVALVALAGLERPARLSSGALLLAAAGVCGAAVLGWRAWRPEPPSPEPAPALVAAAMPPPGAAAPAGLEPPLSAAPPAREPESASAGGAASALAPAAAPDPGLLARRVALVRGRVEGVGLIAPWVAVTGVGVTYRGVSLLAARPCDPDGSFALEVPLERPCDARLVAVAEERLPAWRALTLAPGEIDDAVLALDEPGALAAGYVAEQSSATIAGATVRLWREDAYATFRAGPYELAGDDPFPLAVADVVTDERGRFECLGLSPGRHRAAVLLEDLEDEEGLETLYILGRQSGRRVELPDARLALAPELDELRILVHGPDGPADGVAVFYEEEESFGGASMKQLERLAYQRLQLWPTSPRAFDHAPLPQDGRLRLVFDRGANHVLMLRRVGFEDVFIELATVQAEPDGWLRVALLPTLDLPALTVKLGVPRGEEPKSLDVVLQPVSAEEELQIWAPPIHRVVPFSDPLELHGVPPGRYDLSVEPVGMSPFVLSRTKVQVAFVGPTPPCTLALVRGGTARLFARTGGTVPPDLELVLEGPEGKLLVCTPLEDRELQQGERVELAPRVPPGRWRARLQAGADVLWRGDVRVDPGGVFDVPLEPR